MTCLQMKLSACLLIVVLLSSSIQVQSSSSPSSSPTSTPSVDLNMGEYEMTEIPSAVPTTESETMMPTKSPTLLFDHPENITFSPSLPPVEGNGTIAPSSNLTFAPSSSPTTGETVTMTDSPTMNPIPGSTETPTKGATETPTKVPTESPTKAQIVMTPSPSRHPTAATMAPTPLTADKRSFLFWFAFAIMVMGGLYVCYVKASKKRPKYSNWNQTDERIAELTEFRSDEGFSNDHVTRIDIM